MRSKAIIEEVVIGMTIAEAQRLNNELRGLANGGSELYNLAVALNDITRVSMAMVTTNGSEVVVQ